MAMARTMDSTRPWWSSTRGAVESLEGLEEAVDHSQSQCHGGDAGNLPN
jgi:hypothetical protein